MSVFNGGGHQGSRGHRRQTHDAVSVAGVARRTTRRTSRRTSIYVATLPRGGSTVIVEGVSLSQCGGTYYQASGNQYVVVNVD
jgi:hypothetical protein